MSSGFRSEEDAQRTGGPPRLRPLPRVLASLAVLCLTGTVLAAQLDFVRRHHPGISPARYLWPQLLQVWAPGLAIAAVLGGLAWYLARRAARHRG